MVKEEKTHLTAEQYWKWRYFIQEVTIEKGKHKEALLAHALLNKEIGILTLKTKLQEHKLANLQGNIDKAQKNYEEIKTKLEDELNRSLSGCTIDDATFMIKNLEEV